GRGSLIAAGGPGTKLEQAVGPTDKAGARGDVNTDREDDPDEDRPRPPGVEAKELAATAAHEQVEQAGDDRELGDPKEVAELARHELRERGASGGSRRSEKRRKLYQDGVEAAADPENGRGDVQPVHGEAENHVHSPG